MTALRLSFLGTRGGIRVRSRRHRRHSVLLVEHARGRLVIDCGEDWRGKADAFAADAIVVTHAHPDHARGLAGGARCPVYASASTCRALARAPVELRVTAPNVARTIAGLAVELVPVVHSLRAPAVGVRLDGRVFYVPDVLELRDRRAVLDRVALYIGDGARLTRPLIRRTASGRRFGHTSIELQLGWCADAGVPRAIFTHCGTEVVTGGGEAEARVRAMGEAVGVDARIAVDGLVIEV